MLNTFKIYQELMARMDQAAAETITNILGEMYEDLKNTVTQKDFAQLQIGDKLMPFMKSFVPQVYGVIPRVVERKNIRYSTGRFDEINIYMEGLKDGQPVLIVGECKAHPGRKDLKQFNAILSRLKEHFNMPVEGFIVGYTFSPETEDLLAQEYSHIKAFKTYEVELIANGEML